MVINHDKQVLNLQKSLEFDVSFDVLSNFETLCWLLTKSMNKNSLPHCTSFSPAKNKVNLSFHFHWWYFSIDLFSILCLISTFLIVWCMFLCPLRLFPSRSHLYAILGIRISFIPHKCPHKFSRLFFNCFRNSFFHFHNSSNLDSYVIYLFIPFFIFVWSC